MANITLPKLTEKRAERRNSAIGYEASNYYMFNKYSLAEKVVNIYCLKEYFA